MFHASTFQRVVQNASHLQVFVALLVVANPEPEKPIYQSNRLIAERADHEDLLRLQLSHYHTPHPQIIVRGLLVKIKTNSLVFIFGYSFN